MGERQALVCDCMSTFPAGPESRFDSNFLYRYFTNRMMDANYLRPFPAVSGACLSSVRRLLVIFTPD